MSKKSEKNKKIRIHIHIEEKKYQKKVDLRGFKSLIEHVVQNDYFTNLR